VLARSYETLEVSVEDRCAWVRLNRPEVLNALTAEMYGELAHCAEALAADPGVGAIVLTGNGRAFCAGADLRTFADEVDPSNPHAVRDRMRMIGRVVRTWVGLDKPTIAAVNGAAVGGGCNLALMCDLVLMRADARIGQVYAQRALALDMGGTYFLPRLVGRARANELALLGDTIDADEAERIGLVNRSIPAERFDEEVRTWGHRLAHGAPRAQELIKTGLRLSPAMDLETTLEWEAQAIAMVFQSPDVEEAFAAFLEKRPPRFGG
jgi:2-(1,2-epoxy-1,2-dihydrophenyl)acetyl-CoA isomerase